MQAYIACLKNWSGQETGEKISVQQGGYVGHRVNLERQNRNTIGTPWCWQWKGHVVYAMKRNGQGVDPAQEKLHHAGSIGAPQFLWNPDNIFNAYYGATVFGVCSDGSVCHWSALSLILKKEFLFCAIVYSCFWCSLSSYLRDCSLRRDFACACGRNGDS